MLPSVSFYADPGGHIPSPAPITFLQPDPETLGVVQGPLSCEARDGPTSLRGLQRSAFLLGVLPVIIKGADPHKLSPDCLLPSGPVEQDWHYDSDVFFAANSFPLSVCHRVAHLRVVI